MNNPQSLHTLHTLHTLPPSLPISILYHADCMDGFGAAWAWHTWAKAHEIDDRMVSYLAVRYNEPFPINHIEEGSVVFVVDFSYHANILREAYNQLDLHSIFVIDHHESGERNLQYIDTIPSHSSPIQGVYDYFSMNYSGAYLTWYVMHLFFSTESSSKYFSTDPPTIIRYIQDRDLWRWELASSKEYSAWLVSEEMSFKNWDNFNWVSEGDRIQQGAAILRYQNQQIERIISNSLPPQQKICVVRLHGVLENLEQSFDPHNPPHIQHIMDDRDNDRTEISIPTINTTFSISEICNNLLERFSWGIIAAYYDTQKERIWSIRSSPNSVPVWNCAKLAEQLGGGGHKHAAGWKEKISG